MSQQTQLPWKSQFHSFAARLRECRDTLPGEEQRMLDAMVHASFKTVVYPY